MAKEPLALQVGIQDRLIDGWGALGQPVEEGWAEVKADPAVVVDDTDLS